MSTVATTPAAASTVHSVSPFKLSSDIVEKLISIPVGLSQFQVERLERDPRMMGIPQQYRQTGVQWALQCKERLASKLRPGLARSENLKMLVKQEFFTVYQVVRTCGHDHGAIAGFLKSHGLETPPYERVADLHKIFAIALQLMEFFIII